MNYSVAPPFILPLNSLLSIQNLKKLRASKAEKQQPPSNRPGATFTCWVSLKHPHPQQEGHN